ncbi:MAG: PAS domain S-box protein, partial [Candidatus Zixiibacteriota bacterium]
MSRDTVKLLRKTSIFSFLDPGSLNKISGFFKEETYTTGHIFFRDDSVNDILYVIWHGAVKIIKTGKSGEGRLSWILRREGDFFGETALIEETSPLETAQAVKKTKVLQLSRSDFLTIVSSYPFVAFQIMKALTSRLRQSYLGLIEELGEKDEKLWKACAELKSSADAQAEQRASFSDKIISACPLSIVGTKGDGTVFIFNKAAEKEYGYSPDEVVGKGVDLLRGEGNLSNLDELIKLMLKDKGVWKGEIVARRKNGERFISETTVYTIPEVKGTKPAILWVSKDVTPERALIREALEEEKFLHTKERIKEVALKFSQQVQLLSENLDLLTHEVNESRLPESQARIKALEDILNNLKGILFPLVNFSSPETVKEPVDLVHLIEKELLFLKHQKKFKSIDFITNYDDRLPLIDADPQQMRQLLIDLLDNAAFALKSVPTPEKAITIEVRYSDRHGEIQI